MLLLELSLQKLIVLFWSDSGYFLIFQTHEKVSKRLNSKFRKWHQKWCDEHISESQSRDTNDWLLGQSEGLVRNVTRCLTDNDLSKSPYTQYNRYKVETINSWDYTPWKYELKTIHPNCTYVYKVKRIIKFVDIPTMLHFSFLEIFKTQNKCRYMTLQKGLCVCISEEHFIFGSPTNFIISSLDL